MRGKELDIIVEKELQLMLIEGFEKSPISHKSLYDRLIKKGFIHGSLSTLSTPMRKSLISNYVSSQIKNLNLKPKAEQQYINKKTRQALLDTNENLREELEKCKLKFGENLETLMDIIDEVKLKTTVKVDHLLAPHLLKEYLKRNN